MVICSLSLLSYTVLFISVLLVERSTPSRYRRFSLFSRLKFLMVANLGSIGCVVYLKILVLPVLLLLCSLLVYCNALCGILFASTQYLHEQATHEFLKNWNGNSEVALAVKVSIFTGKVDGQLALKRRDLLNMNQVCGTTKPLC